MGNNEEEDDSFFDAPDEQVVSSPSQDFGDLSLWTTDPDSVSNRRRKFFQTMGFSFKKEDEIEQQNDEEKKEDDVLLMRNESTTSSGFDVSSSSEEDTDDQTLLSRNESSSSRSSMPEGLSESGSSKSGSFGDFSPSGRDDSVKRSAKSWLKKLGVFTHVLDSMDCESVGSPMKRRVARVQTYKKQFKELSSMCIDQEFAAHDGSILAMKFSHDGKYIASGGEDCVVRVWSVIEEERTDQYEVAEVDSGVYFGMNEHSQIEPLKMNNEKIEKKTSTSFLRKSVDATCVVLPSKIFRISEKPLHEFVGHVGEILALSWSERGYLLSSSVDETVRLWRVGSDECLRTFSHNNFVTCVAFNPVDDNFFISGSIDGKVRIWDVTRSRVVDYTDIRDIVTAVCYSPDAKGVVVGSMTGICRFYDTVGNQMELDREINLHGKKKMPSKRITGIEYFPNELDKVMVTSADSHVRIVCREDVICKLKASSLRTTSASLTLDGKHIVTTSEDSGIQVWNYSQLPSKKVSSGKLKNIRSYEGFISHNTIVPIPWLREENRNSLSECVTDMDNRTPKLDCFSPMKGSTTWPEEKLEEEAGMSKREKLKLLRRAYQPHLWGLVVVTATWDGRIRVFHNYGLPIRV